MGTFLVYSTHIALRETAVGNSLELKSTVWWFQPPAKIPWFECCTAHLKPPLCLGSEIASRFGEGKAIKSAKFAMFSVGERRYTASQSLAT